MRSKLDSRLRIRDAVRARAVSREKGRPSTDTKKDELVILLAEPDPYLTFLIELNFPGSRVLQAGSDIELDSLLAKRPTLAMVNAGGARARAILDHEDHPPVIGIVEDAEALRDHVADRLDGLLVRPFDPGQLADVIRNSIGLQTRRLPVVRHTMPPHLRGLLPSARFGAVALAAILEVAGVGLGTGRASVLASAFAYATIRFFFRWHGKLGAGIDVAVAATCIALTGGLASAYWPLGLFASASAGLTLGIQFGTLAGATIAFASLQVIIKVIRLDPGAPSQLLGWFGVFVLTGFAGGLAGRIWTNERQEGARILEEANRVLSSLHHIARVMPGGLEISTVAENAIEELRDSLRAPAGAMLLEEAGAFRVADSFALAAPHLVKVMPGYGGLARALTEGPCIVRRSELHSTNAEALGIEQCWLAAPMRRGNGPLGLLLAACPDHEHHEQNRLYLQHMADETAVAVENAKLFRNVRELSVDEERRRLAREMHDGVAQALTHVRLELEFMGRNGSIKDIPSKQEITRLVRVVDRAIADVRSMIIGLRSSVSADGLTGSLRAYLRDLRGLGGPELSFAVRGEVDLPTEVEAEMFRIAQEAVSNATRHARANNVSVRLDQIEDRVRLSIDDDGSGFVMDSVRDGAVGLQAMRERAERIGARLTIQSVLGKGTSVEIVYSRQQASDKSVETGSERKIVLEGRSA